MAKNKQVSKKFAWKKYAIIAGIAVAIAAAAYGGYSSMIPVNSKVPVLGVPENMYITSQHATEGYVFASKSTTGGKKMPGATHITPVLHVSKGQLASIHFINEDTTAKHNFNIDEFNVHSRDLNYFETQSITFVADKAGTFKYHCTLHPEMNGEVIVQ